MKNIYPREGGYWYGKMIQGKMTWVNLQTRDYAEAVKRTIEIRNNPLVTSRDPIEMIIRKFKAHKISEERWSKNSQDSKPQIIERFFKSLPANATPANVSTQQLKDFYDGLKKPRKHNGNTVQCSEATAQGYMGTLQSFFTWAKDVERIRVDNPILKVSMAKLKRISRQPFVESKADQEKLIKDAPNDELRFILYCGFHAGLRREEICEARRRWFNLAGGTMSVLKCEGADLQPGERPFRIKDRDERTIPLTLEFKGFLTEYLQGLEPHEFCLYPDVKYGKWRYRYDFRRPYSEYMKSKGFGWVHIHVMRRTFASLRASRGVSLYKIAKWLGDTLKTTEENYAYLQERDDDIERA